MSADHIGGIAILKSDPVGQQYLHCFGIREGRLPVYIAIPVCEKGKTSLVSRSWQYDRSGTTLNVSPSVLCRGGRDGVEIFHNSGQWSIEFKEVTSDPFKELIAANPQIGDFQ